MAWSGKTALYRIRLAKHQTGMIVVDFNPQSAPVANDRAAIYARVSSDELMQDLVAIVTSFAARLYGQRRAKRKTEKIIQELSEGENETS